MPNPDTIPSGQRKGLTEDEVRDAVKERGSMRGAADELDVTRTTIRDWCIRHDIEVPSIGGVPEPCPSDT